MYFVTTLIKIFFGVEFFQDELTNFLDEFNHQIFEMVSSPDMNERKGGILAIGIAVVPFLNKIFVALFDTNATSWTFSTKN